MGDSSPVLQPLSCQLAMACQKNVRLQLMKREPLAERTKGPGSD